MRLVVRVVRRVPCGPGPLAVAGSAFTVLTALLFSVGLSVGVGLIELVPTAVVESMVIAGIVLVACLPADETAGDGGPEPPRDGDPETPPPVFDPTVWLPLFDGWEPPPDSLREALPEPVAAGR